MEDVLSTVYSQYLPSKLGTYRNVSRRSQRDVGSSYILRAPLKPSELHAVFNRREQDEMRAFIITASLITSNWKDSPTVIAEKVSLSDERIYAFGVVDISEESLSNVTIKFYINTSNHDSEFHNSITSEEYKDLWTAAVYRKLHTNFNEANMAFDRLSYYQGKTSRIVDVNADLKSKREVLLARCEKFGIDPILVVKALTDEVQYMIDTMNNLSLACYALVNAICLDVEHSTLKHLIQASSRNSAYVLDMEEVRRILFECHAKVIYLHTIVCKFFPPRKLEWKTYSQQSIPTIYLRNARHTKEYRGEVREM